MCGKTKRGEMVAAIEDLHKKNHPNCEQNEREESARKEGRSTPKAEEIGGLSAANIQPHGKSTFMDHEPFGMERCSRASLKRPKCDNPEMLGQGKFGFI